MEQNGPSIFAFQSCITEWTNQSRQNSRFLIIKEIECLWAVWFGAWVRVCALVSLPFCNLRPSSSFFFGQGTFLVHKTILIIALKHPNKHTHTETDTNQRRNEQTKENINKPSRVIVLFQDPSHGGRECKHDTFTSNLYGCMPGGPDCKIIMFSSNKPIAIVCHHSYGPKNVPDSRMNVPSWQHKIIKLVWVCLFLTFLHRLATYSWHVPFVNKPLVTALEM